jgi:(R,R)-butanediol dehydrogenase/meso-butanediol dehydrogenase/diacetyl reductase
VRVLTIHGVNDVRLDPIEAPRPGSKDAVIRVKACGICGSDLTYIKIGGIPPGHTTPIGHEAAGEVVSVGADVQGVSAGDRVAINPMNTPSFIGSGGPEGAFTEELLVRDARLGDNLLPIADDLPYEVAALTEPLSVALHTVNRTQAKPGEKAAVFGCGPIGLGIVLWLVDRGVTDVVALDLVPERLERALALGARAVIDPGKEDVRTRLTELHGTVPRRIGEGVGTHVYIDAAGAPNILNDVIGMSKERARLVVTAVYMQPVALDLTSMLMTEVTMTTSMGYPTEMPEVVAALPRIREKAASMISHRMPFDQVIEALDVAADPESAKVMIDFERGTA